MPFTVPEFLAWCETEEGKNFGKIKCNICGNFLDVMDEEEGNKISGKPVCSDCYYAEFGKLIDEQGFIGVPHKHRGGCGAID
jgi:hypothetical protein